MAGKYYKVANDGALWRCTECRELHSYNHVIVALVRTETGPEERRLICLDCVDDEWLENAEQVGVL